MYYTTTFLSYHPDKMEMTMTISATYTSQQHRSNDKPIN